MTTEDDFHRALDANPDDWQTRLVFADWLDDRGDPRAEGYRALGHLRLCPFVDATFYWWTTLPASRSLRNRTVSSSHPNAGATTTTTRGRATATGSFPSSDDASRRQPDARGVDVDVLGLEFLARGVQAQRAHQARPKRLRSSSFRTRRRILPDAVLGMASTNWISCSVL